MKRIHHLSFIICHFTIAIAILTSCERLPLYDETNNLVLDIAIDYNIKHTTDIPEPEMMFVGFYEPGTGKMHHTEYTGPQGGRIFAEPGNYDILVYNFDTEATLIRNNENINTAEAYTNFANVATGRAFRSLAARLIEHTQGQTRAREYVNQQIINEPDHLFAGIDDNVDIPIRGNSNETFTIKADASTLLETYSVKLMNIIGIENIQSAEVFLTGQAQSKLIASRKITGQPSVLHIDLQPATRADGSLLATTFRTFGLYPSPENVVTMIVRIVDKNGDVTVLEEDVTKQLDNPTGEILILRRIEIAPPRGAGLAPSVDDWNDNTTYIFV